LANNIELHAIFKGRVQGIGFRWTIVDYAERFHLMGTTANLSDGTVEVYAQGAKEQLEAFLRALCDNPGFARIDSVKSQYRPAKKNYPDFKIIH